MSESADFVERFARWWRDPDPDRLGDLLAEDVRLVQPIAPDTFTLADGQKAFRRLFRFLPDLRGEVHDSSTDGDVAFIHFTLTATYGGRPISWDAVDRFVLREDGLATERVSFFDSQPLALQMLMRPRGWVQLARSGFRPQIRARPQARASAQSALSPRIRGRSGMVREASQAAAARGEAARASRRSKRSAFFLKRTTERSLISS